MDKGCMQEQRNDTFVIAFFLRWSAGPDTGLQLVSKPAYIHNPGQLKRSGGVGTNGARVETPADRVDERVGLSASLRLQKADQRIGWLAVRAWR
jgi:hypothetical protein